MGVFEKIKVPLAGMLKPLIGFLSNIVNTVTPDEVTLADKKKIQMYVGGAYGLLANIAEPLVLDTDNDIDDAIVEEFLEICEKLEDKYGLQLNPKELDWSVYDED